MRTLALIVVLCVAPLADAGKDAPSREQIEQDLVLTTKPLAATKVRAGEPMRVEATLTNRSATRTHKVVNPGSGSELGLVEPFVYYTARFQPHEGKARDLTSNFPPGMCGMGDYRWLPRIQDLAPGASLEFGTNMACASLTLDMKQPGRYDVQVHYEYRAKGATTKLPQSDPIGELGAMKPVPAFKVSAKSVRFDVVRPFEVFVDVTGKIWRGVKTRMSDLITVRVENWTRTPITLQNNTLDVRIEGVGHPPSAIRREPMDTPSAVLMQVLHPGKGFAAVGPQTGWSDEEWTPAVDGPVRVRAVVRGYAEGAEAVRSHVVEIPAAK